MRVAAIDCGTNSIRLLIADVDADGGLHDLVRRMEIVRLGYGVDRTGVLDPERMAATLAMTREYAQQCREYAVDRIRFTATSASRDAANAADFVAGVQEAFGDLRVTPEVISGAEEAGLSFRGATGDLVAAGIPGPYLVVDIGGGSSEFVLGTHTVSASLSTDIGCVRLTERHLRSDPPSDAEIAAARADVERAIDAAADVVPLARARTLVGLAGSITTVTAHALALPSYQPDRIHLGTLNAAQVRAACHGLVAMTRAQRAALPFMHPGRVDVIGAGALIWSVIVDRVMATAGPIDIVTSEHDILDGIALSIASQDPA